MSKMSSFINLTLLATVCVGAVSYIVSEDKPASNTEKKQPSGPPAIKLPDNFYATVTQCSEKYNNDSCMSAFQQAYRNNLLGDGFQDASTCEKTSKVYACDLDIASDRYYPHMIGMILDLGDGKENAQVYPVRNMKADKCEDGSTQDMKTTLCVDTASKNVFYWGGFEASPRDKDDVLNSLSIERRRNRWSMTLPRNFYASIEQCSIDYNEDSCTKAFTRAYQKNIADVGFDDVTTCEHEIGVITCDLDEEKNKYYPHMIGIILDLGNGKESAQVYPVRNSKDIKCQDTTIQDPKTTLCMNTQNAQTPNVFYWGGFFNYPYSTYGGSNILIVHPSVGGGYVVTSGSSGIGGAVGSVEGGFGHASSGVARGGLGGSASAHGGGGGGE